MISEDLLFPPTVLKTRMLKDCFHDKSMKPTPHQKLISFLKDDLAIPSASIDLAVRHQPDAHNQLPMILWQYGLVTLEQLDRIFDWLETA